jgi:hypothetical protein
MTIEVISLLHIVMLNVAPVSPVFFWDDSELNRSRAGGTSANFHSVGSVQLTIVPLTRLRRRMHRVLHAMLTARIILNIRMAASVNDISANISTPLGESDITWTRPPRTLQPKAQSRSLELCVLRSSGPSGGDIDSLQSFIDVS